MEHLQFGDNLGIAGIVMGLVGAGLALIFPTKRWIGVIFLILAAALVIWWAILYFNAKPEIIKVTPDISWFPASLRNEEMLGPGQLNALATVVGIPVKGKYVYNPTSGTPLPISETVHVTFTPIDLFKYLPSERTITVKVISPPHPQTNPTFQRPPIKLNELPVSGRPVVGGAVSLSANIQNVSGATIKERDISGVEIEELPSDPESRAELEDKLWGALMAELNKNGAYNEITTGGKGLRNKILTTGPLSDGQTALLTSGGAVYFLLVIQDVKTKKNLVELCGFANKPVLTMCHSHNKP